MTPTLARGVSVVVGVVVMLGAGFVAGGWMWIAALIGAAGAGGAAVDRQFTLLQVLAVLVATVGLASADAAAYVVVLVTGTLGSIELTALADRVTVVRPVVPRPLGAAIAALLGGALTVSTLVIGTLRLPVQSLGVVGACVAATLTLRVIAR